MGLFMSSTSGTKLEILQVKDVFPCLTRTVTLTIQPDPYPPNEVLRAYEEREDVEAYKVVLREIFHLPKTANIGYYLCCSM